MAIQITCSACSVRLSLGDDRAGDRFECPQCDAVIKVPYPEGQLPPKPAPAPKPVAKAPSRPLEPDDDEPRGPDKRVIAGIAAGVLALLIVGAAVVMFAVRKPKDKDVAKVEEVPAPVVAKPVVPPPVPKKAPVFDDSPPAIGNTPSVVTPIAIDPPPVTGDSGKQYVTSFLGSQAKGQRFCIVADNSGSMKGANIANLKVQLLKTLDEMDPNAEFYIYFFNSVSEPMPHPTWLKPGAAETAEVREWIKKTPSRGGTNPVPSFEQALKLDPKPDVVFLMTDGIFAPTVPNKVTELNGTPAKSAVNTILFEARGGFAAPPKGAINGEAQLKQIAEKNGGTFTRYTPP